MARGFFATTAAMAIVCGSYLPAAEPADKPPGDNTLSDAERQAGWQLLFDGKTTTGWMWADEKPVSASHVQDGSLNPHPRDHDYLILYREPVKNFVLSLDFKISPHCNSGVFVRTWPLTPRQAGTSAPTAWRSPSTIPPPPTSTTPARSTIWSSRRSMP